MDTRLDNATAVVHDRDSKYSGPFDEVFRTEGVKVVLTPFRAPRANAYAERWVRSVRSECLDWTLVRGRRHLERVVRTYAEHYNTARPHRGLELASPSGARSPQIRSRRPPAVRPRDLLGGLTHEYQVAA
jgi:putative transposase